MYCYVLGTKCRPVLQRRGLVVSINLDKMFGRWMMDDLSCREQPWNAKLKELYAGAMDKNLADWVQERFKDVSWTCATPSLFIYMMCVCVFGFWLLALFVEVDGAE